MKNLQSFKKEKVDLKEVNGGRGAPVPTFKVSGQCIPSAPGGSDCNWVLGDFSL